MAQITRCDGCGEETATATPVGHLAPVDYCPSCQARWDAYRDLEAVERAQAIRAFEAWRVATQATIGLQKIPDA